MAFWLSLQQIRASNQYNAGNQTWSWNASPNLGQNQGSIWPNVLNEINQTNWVWIPFFKYSRISSDDFKCSILSREWKLYGKLPSAINMLVGPSALQILFMTAWMTKSHLYRHPHNHQWHKPSHRCRLPSAHPTLRASASLSILWEGCKIGRDSYIFHWSQRYTCYQQTRIQNSLWILHCMILIVTKSLRNFNTRHYLYSLVPYHLLKSFQ